MAISRKLRQQVQQHFKGCCAYCRVSAKHIYAPMHIDHIIPEAAGGRDEAQNLCLSCPRCNGFKGQRLTAPDPQTEENVTLFNPRTQNWSQHFTWGDDHALIIGQTACGRATVEALNLNLSVSLQIRQLLAQAGLYPPLD